MGKYPSNLSDCWEAILRNYWLILLFMLLFLPCSAGASSQVYLEKHISKYSLGPYLEFLEDKQGDLTLNDVLKPEQQKEFFASTSRTPNFGLTKSVYWSKFSLVNPLDKEQFVLLENEYPHIDGIQMFVFRDGKKIASVQAGDMVPHKDKGIDYRKPIIKLTIPPLSTTHVFMRFQTESTMQLSLTIWRPVAFAEKINREQTFIGIYFGIMGAMLFYNLFLFIFLRERNYLYYILYLIFITLTQLQVSRLDVVYLWPDSPVFANLSHPVFINLTYFFAGLFSRSFLNTKDRTPYIDKVILLVMGVSLFSILLTFVSGYTAGVIPVVYFTVFFGPLSVLVAGIKCWVNGLTIARYYTIAWSALLVSLIIFNFRNLGVLANSPIIQYSVYIGTAIEVIFLSLALGDRITMLKNDKIDAQIRAFEAEKALTKMLEKEVEEQTSHINQLSGLLPICASCKNIRDDQGYWQQVEEYIGEHSDAVFSHSVCPDCIKKLYPELADSILRGKDTENEDD